MNAPQPQITINPQDVANAGLQFLARVEFRKHERAAFDALEALLTAIANGTVTLAQPRSNGASVADAPMEVVAD